MNKISYSLNGRNVILRLTIQNHSVDANTPLAVGYIFKNFKGQEIASTNSQIEGHAIDSIPEGCYLTVQIKVSLPYLSPGSYAFSLTAGYIQGNGEILLSDRIENAVVFDVLSNKPVYVLMTFPTTFKVEK
jgi:lipopolysaccharide transport system ATP-binding protein